MDVHFYYGCLLRSFCDEMQDKTNRGTAPWKVIYCSENAACIDYAILIMGFISCPRTL